MAAVPAPDTPGGTNFLRWLQFRVSGSTFECPSVYQLVKPIGKGGEFCWSDLSRQCTCQAPPGAIPLSTLPLPTTLGNPSPAAAYGIVCAAIDSRTNQQVAIKKIGDIFSNPLDARRTLREIQVWSSCCCEGGAAVAICISCR